MPDQDPRNTADQGQQHPSGVAMRYAKAIFELARENGVIDAVSQDFVLFESLVAKSADLARVIRSPAFTRDEQLRAISGILAAARIDGLAANFLKLAASKRRLFAVQGMIQHYHALVAESRGIVAVEVTFAEPPPPSRLDMVKRALRDIAKSDVAMTVKIDPALIGGLIVKLGSRMVDASVRSKLNSLRLALKEAR